MALRASRLDGNKFRRQAILGNRIVDFFCPAKGLVIEVDGDTHDREADAKRDAKLLSTRGFRTLRFTNLDIARNFDGVLIEIMRALETTPDRWPDIQETTPQPPPLKRRGRQSVAQCLREAAQALTESSDTPRLDAELLMAHALGTDRSRLLLRHMDDVAPEEFASLLARRLTHEPVAYILGEQEFFGLDFAVNPAVLIPRPDSEVLVERALAARPDAKNVLDCGTGSGALLLAVLHNLPEAHGTGIDRSSTALEVSRINAKSLDLSERARFECADWSLPGWTDALEPPFDLILANPPYVEDNAELSRSVRDFEPGEALFAGPAGLDAYRTLIPQFSGLLAKNGVALVEIGATQAEAVMQIAESAVFTAKLHRDLAGKPRTVELSAAS